MGRRRRALVVSTALALAWGAIACSVYDASLVGGGGDDWEIDEMPGGVGDLPTAPPSSTSSTSDSETLVFAMRDIVLNQSEGNAWQTIGLDLDRLTTEASDPERECVPATGTPAVDGQDGVDNILGQTLWGIIETELESLPCEIDLSHTAGRGTILFRVDKWNGTSDDAQVTVSIAPSVDGTSFDGDPSTLTWDGFTLMNGASEAAEPAWDGNDLFFLNPRAFFAATGTPLLQDVNAYIVDDTIVITLATNATFELLTDNRSVPIVLSQGYLLAEMDPTRTTIERGILAGRYPLAQISTVGGSIGICAEDQGGFATIYNNLGDVLASPRPAGTPPNPEAACTAISLGVLFEGTAAQWIEDDATPEQPAAVWCDTEPAVPAACL